MLSVISNLADISRLHGDYQQAGRQPWWRLYVTRPILLFGRWHLRILIACTVFFMLMAGSHFQELWWHTGQKTHLEDRHLAPHAAKPYKSIPWRRHAHLSKSEGRNTTTPHRKPNSTPKKTRKRKQKYHEVKTNHSTTTSS